MKKPNIAPDPTWSYPIQPIPVKEQCKCACHKHEWNSRKKHSPVLHDTKCCEHMNGALTQNEGDERRRFYQMGYDEAVQTIKRDLFDIAIKDKNENLLLTLIAYIKKL